MKIAINILAVLLFLAFVASCKEKVDGSGQAGDEQQVADPDGRTVKQADGLTLLKGDFLYFADAAVLQTHREIYGVIIDSKMHELNDMVQQFKTEKTDMVPVEIRGIITAKPNGEEGWPFRIEIKEILNVSKPQENTNKIIILEE